MTEREKSGSSKVKGLWKEFILGTSIHGIRYLLIRLGYFNVLCLFTSLIFKYSETAISKISWTLAIAFSFALCSVLIQGSINAWLDNPFVTNYKSVVIEELDFPAVTICPNSWAL